MCQEHGILNVTFRERGESVKLGIRIPTKYIVETSVLEYNWKSAVEKRVIYGCKGIKSQSVGINSPRGQRVLQWGIYLAMTYLTVESGSDCQWYIQIKHKDVERHVGAQRSWLGQKIQKVGNVTLSRPLTNSLSDG